MRHQFESDIEHGSYLFFRPFLGRGERGFGMRSKS